MTSCTCSEGLLCCQVSIEPQASSDDDMSQQAFPTVYITTRACRAGLTSHCSRKHGLNFSSQHVISSQVILLCSVSLGDCCDMSRIPTPVCDTKPYKCLSIVTLVRKPKVPPGAGQETCWKETKARTGHVGGVLLSCYLHLHSPYFLWAGPSFALPRLPRRWLLLPACCCLPPTEVCLDSEVSHGKRL